MIGYSCRPLLHEARTSRCTTRQFSDRAASQSEPNIAKERKITSANAKSSSESELEFWTRASEILHVTKMSDWYSITRKVIRKLDGSLFVDKIHQGSMYKALKHAYPSHDWKPWCFVQTDSGFWSDPANIRTFLDWVAPQVKVERLEDWYKIQARDALIPLGGGGLLAHHKYSLLNILRAAYPDHEWLPWKLVKAPRMFWNDIENQKRFLRWLGTQHGIRESNLEGWYSISQSELEKDSALKSLINNKYDGAFLNLLEAMYPDHEWHPWKFPQAPARFWSQRANQRRYLDWLGTKLGFNSKGDYYKLTKTDLNDTGGGALVQNYFKGSVAAAVAAAYPDHKFLPWKFERLEKRFWETPANRRQFLDFAAHELQLRRAEDWYSVSAQQLCNIGGRAALARYNGNIRLLVTENYPEHNWVPEQFTQPGSS
eukprot:TRINITY_DN1987_c0_g1_i2.p1 TRINITY_DN1987_c0_g1~~TRINITY_DN1987_c0_g1_i2.p1  ORF type:complete len:428 (-),score=45.11 TRINITY_DN1987_c0_g1_i2:930-2213(-)